MLVWKKRGVFLIESVKGFTYELARPHKRFYFHIILYIYILYKQNRQQLKRFLFYSLTGERSCPRQAAKVFIPLFICLRTSAPHSFWPFLLFSRIQAFLPTFKEDIHLLISLFILRFHKWKSIYRKDLPTDISKNFLVPETHFNVFITCVWSIELWLLDLCLVSVPKYLWHYILIQLFILRKPVSDILYSRRFWERFWLYKLGLHGT